MLMVASASWAEGPYEIKPGDTLWDLSGTFRGDRFGWPRLWADNPQIHNPHWLYPGDLLFPQGVKPGELVFELPLTRLTPPSADGGAAVDAGKGGASGDKAAAAARAKPRTDLSVPESAGQGFIAATRPKRLGTIDNRVVKIASAEVEEVEFVVNRSDNLKVGDEVSLINDDRVIRHPITDAPMGVHVHVLGFGKIIGIEAGHARVKVAQSYSEILNGDGVVPFRKPILQVVPKRLGQPVEGVVVTGEHELLMYGYNDLVFLDRGKRHGLESGSILDIPLPRKKTPAEGISVDLDKPMARMVVVDVQDATASGYIFESRAVVTPGLRFVAAVSP
jgi:hypothetical protein